MPIGVKLVGMPEVRQAIIGLPQKIEREALLRMSQIAYDSMQLGADRHTKTGALFQSVYNRPLGEAGREVGHDPERAPYAAFVLFGTRPHRISARTRKALRWPSGDSFRFARWVNHPGYAGDDYLTTSARDALDELNRIISDISIFE